MKRFLTLCLLMLLSAAAASGAVTPTLTLKGWLVDNSCAAQHKNDMASFVEVHDMSCARTCGQTSGFSLYANQKLYPINRSETAKILRYFGADFNNDTKVVVTAKNIKGKLKILTIKSWK